MRNGWRDDALFARSGIRSLRYAPPWPKARRRVQDYPAHVAAPLPPQQQGNGDGKPAVEEAAGPSVEEPEVAAPEKSEASLATRPAGADGAAGAGEQDQQGACGSPQCVRPARPGSSLVPASVLLPPVSTASPSHLKPVALPSRQPSHRAGVRTREPRRPDPPTRNRSSSSHLAF